MINRELIRGEKIRRNSQRFSDPAKKLMEGIQSSAALMAPEIAMRSAKKAAANQRISTYINQLSSDVDLTELTASQQASVSKKIDLSQNRITNSYYHLHSKESFVKSNPQEQHRHTFFQFQVGFRLKQDA